MATVTLYLKSTQLAGGGNWSYVGGAADFSVLRTADGDASYALVGDVTGGGRTRYELDDMPSIGSGTIDGVETEFRMKDDPGSSGGTIKTEVGNTAAGGPVALTERASAATWKTYAELAATDALGNPWTEALINDASAGFRKIAGGALTGIRVTFLWWNVDYTITGTPGAGGSMAFMSGILLPLVGAGLTWGQMRKEVGPFLRAQRQRIQLSPRELWMVYQDLIGHPRRAYLLPY